MAKSKSYGGLIVLLLLLVAGAAGSWYYFNAKTDKAPEFQTTKVGRGDIIQSVTATGDLQPVITVDVGAQVSGQIKEVLVDFNSQVKAGDVLAKIDEATPVQKLNQAQADLASAEANNRLVVINSDRTKELFEKKLVSQQELDSINAQLAQSNATMLTRKAAVENAKLDLSRCTIISPIDGIVLDRKTDVGRTVNSSMNAPTLFTLVNDLTKMRIMAAVAEADIGNIAEGQDVKFSVDAFPSRVFSGVVKQVRNAASANQSVVSYATVIDVNNDDLKLKPGMTANVSIIVAQKMGVMRVANSALRVRLPAEMQPKGAEVKGRKGDGEKAGEKSGDKAATDKGGVAGSMTDDERMRATQDIMRDIGYERGTPPSPDMIAKAKKLAKDKGLDPDLVAARMSMPAGGKRVGGAERSSGGSRGARGGGASAAFNNTIVERQLYKLADPAATPKKIEPITARLGISDGSYTEVLAGLSEGDTLITAVIMPGAAPVLQAPGGSSGMQNPFQSSSRGYSGGSSSGMRGPPGR